MATEAQQTFSVIVLTPNAELFSDRATSVSLPGFDGEVGILSRHGDFLGELGTGSLTIVCGDNEKEFFMVSEGLYRLADGTLTVLAMVGEDVDSIEVEEVESRLSKLEDEIEELQADSPEFQTAQLSIVREKARLDTAQKAAH